MIIRAKYNEGHSELSTESDFGLNNGCYFYGIMESYKYKVRLVACLSFPGRGEGRRDSDLPNSVLSMTPHSYLQVGTPNTPPIQMKKLSPRGRKETHRTMCELGTHISLDVLFPHKSQGIPA